MCQEPHHLHRKQNPLSSRLTNNLQQVLRNSDLPPAILSKSRVYFFLVSRPCHEYI